MKISITLSADLLEAIDRLARPKRSRSGFIENALTSFISNIERDRNNGRDLEIINRRARRLNREASDTLEYQSFFEISAH
ncbi:MAG TPA: ribbon-helix-helix protein, CopG family [Blastocatellia bacterium]|nr:ribbon-helix-helix protein, CopG family [Blastocatellia bacterium]